MPDRENVILGIENCLQTDSVTECSKTECPFIKCREACLEWLLRSALTLLKEQEPRVLTQEEIEAYNGYCWFEKNNATIMCVSLIKDGQIFDFGDPPYDMKFLNWSYYGKKWRCWSAQPADEQRRAVKWE